MIKISANMSKTKRPYWYLQIEDDEMMFCVKAKDAAAAMRMAISLKKLFDAESEVISRLEI